MKNNILQNNVINYVNNIIELGIKYKSSDIHLKYNEREIEIKYRVNGVLTEIIELFEIFDKKNIEKNIVEIVSRIKILANMNVTEKRKPQDGSFSFFINETKSEKIDIRVAILPILNGESVVIRILKNFLKDIKLETLGFNERNIELIEKMIQKKYGMIIVTGPTGSGKTTTLTSIVNILNNGKKKIISIEDPVENRIDGITQVQVNTELGVTFAEILRSSLRSDPDIIIISEIRDEITAEIAVRAALTGHLVIATLHTNDAISTIIRLSDMGIAKYLILDSLVGVIAQRLVDRENKDGRTVISEILYVTDEVKNILKKNDINSNTKKIIKGIEKYCYVDFYDDIKEKINKNILDEKIIYEME